MAIIESEEFGDVAFVAIGATMVRLRLPSIRAPGNCLLLQRLGFRSLAHAVNPKALFFKACEAALR